GKQRVTLGKARSLPKDRTVIKHYVDADKLLKDRQADAHPDNRADLAGSFIDKVAEARFVVVGQGVVDFLNFDICTMLTVKLPQYQLRFFSFIVGDQEARAFRNQE